MLSAYACCLAAIPPFALWAEVIAAGGDGLRRVRTKELLASAVVAGLAVKPGVDAVGVVAVNLSHLLGDNIMPATTVLGAFGY